MRQEEGVCVLPGFERLCLPTALFLLYIEMVALPREGDRLRFMSDSALGPSHQIPGIYSIYSEAPNTLGFISSFFLTQHLPVLHCGTNPVLN